MVEFAKGRLRAERNQVAVLEMSRCGTADNRDAGQLHSTMEMKVSNFKHPTESKRKTYFSSTLLWASVLTPAGNMAVRGVLTSATVDRAFFFDSRFLADASEARLDLEELARLWRFVEDAALPDLAEASLGGLARKALMR